MSEEKKITAADIIADERELWLNSPIDYAYAERVEKNNISGLKSLLINIFAGADEPGGAGDAIRAATHEEVIQTYLNNGFTFDTEWFGKRELPKGIDGKSISRLDDPAYRRSIGLQ